MGNGDFRSEECIELLKETDLIITNPPFSLFREYLDQLISHDKKFLVIGNANAITYKETFKLIKENKVWLGVSPRSMTFKRPNGTTLDVNACWFTNLPHKKRNEELFLYKTYAGNESEYPKYDNYDAIEVSKVVNIPVDYEGAMGVPITFLEKFNPNQFEILGLTSGRDEFDAIPTKRYENPLQHNDDNSTVNGSKANTRATLLFPDIPGYPYYTANNVEGFLQILYARIIIKRKSKNEN